MQVVSCFGSAVCYSHPKCTCLQQPLQGLAALSKKLHAEYKQLWGSCLSRAAMRILVFCMTVSTQLSATHSRMQGSSVNMHLLGRMGEKQVPAGASLALKACIPVGCAGKPQHKAQDVALDVMGCDATKIRVRVRPPRFA